MGRAVDDYGMERLDWRGEKNGAVLAIESVVLGYIYAFVVKLMMDFNPIFA